MAVLIRTSDLPAARRHDAWRGIVCDTLGPLDLRIDPDAPLHGEIEFGKLGSVGVGRIQTSTPHSVHRTSGLIRRDNLELYRVVLTLSGSPRLSQDGRNTQLSRGEFAIYDFSRPYELAYDSAVWLAVFSVPRGQLAVPADAVAELAALPITAESGPPRWPCRCCGGWRWTMTRTGPAAPRGCPAWWRTWSAPPWRNASTRPGRCPPTPGSGRC
ncbi:Transcriptional regulator, AraC family [[Actinomadura] parvosata subsp. kistnae]|uniref:cupin domain-containing protein n=1 Tax=[Actinomadura] parvosata TaxID=1955412 RepID=UPI000D28B4AB|nr:Transcriptional regulator, AraC family [Actinomadura parvosata subsp. kistnae]